MHITAAWLAGWVGVVVLRALVAWHAGVPFVAVALTGLGVADVVNCAVAVALAFPAAWESPETGETSIAAFAVVKVGAEALAGFAVADVGSGAYCAARARGAQRVAVEHSWRIG